MKPSEIVKPTNIGDFLRLQISCLTEEMEGIRFVARFDHCRNYLPAKPIIALMAVYEITRTPAVSMSFLVTDRIEDALSLFERNFSGMAMARELGVAWVELKNGLSLQPVHIPKPWGQEIWYTGIEQRGVSRVGDESGNSPLDWIIAAAPEHILGSHKTPILLKILDPLPDEVYGDLYFEMHEEKQEVYVVTHVDPAAWPQGIGGIRFGFDQLLRKTFSSDAAFKQAYLEAVHAYRNVRQQVDSLLDNRRAEEGIGLNDPVMPEKICQWQQGLPGTLLEEEKRLRGHMERFIAIKPLVVGDVVKVPCFTPHSLQHGVRTVEFQTPVYERKILSFAQKVLTQDHWDTESALHQLMLQTPEEKPLTRIEESRHMRREQVVQFSDFGVERLTLQTGAKWHLSGGSYRLLMLVTGDATLNGLVMRREQANLIPVNTDIELLSQAENTVLLLAEPR